jgi:hypothetical protein
VKTATEIMTGLTSHDARVVIEDGRVRLLFPVGHPPPEALIEAARFHKHALRAILENRQETRPSGPYGHLFAALQSRCPELVDPDRWQQAVKDADSFLATWSAQAHALGWTERELLGGRAVVALTETEAAIQGATAVLIYRRQRKPALEPAGDSLDDWGTS